MKETCIFCKICAKEIPSHTVYETNEVIAFLDIHPSVVGHTLLIPKAHTKTMMDANEGLIANIFVEAQRLMKAYQNIFNVSHVKLSVIGVDVDHFHIHIKPIYKETPEDMSLELVKEKIVKGLTH